MKRQAEATEEIFLPREVWDLVLVQVGLVEKMSFGKTSKRNYQIAHESVSEIDPKYFCYESEFNHSIFPQERMSDEDLARFCNLTSLNLSGSHFFSDKCLVNFSRLQKLNLGDCHRLTDSGLGRLTTLTSLNLEENRFISDAGLLPLAKNLQSLSLSYNRKIKSESIRNFTALTHLDLSYNQFIKDDDLSLLTNLSSLDLHSNYQIASSLFHLTNLRKLVLYKNEPITDKHLSILTNLKELYMNRNINITGECFSLLTNLRILSVQDQNVQYQQITHLTKLKELTVPLFYDQLSDEIIRKLTKLVKLDLGLNSSAAIRFDTIKSLKKLKELSMVRNRCSFYWECFQELPNLKVNGLVF